MKATITPDDRLRLIGLLALAKDVVQQQKQIERAAARILDYEDENKDIDNPYYGHVSDAVYSAYSADQLLDHLGVKVADDIGEVIAAVGTGRAGS